MYVELCDRGSHVNNRDTGQGETGSLLFTGYKSGVQSQDRRRMWCGAGQDGTLAILHIFQIYLYPDLMHTSLIACRSQKLKKSADTAFFQRSLKTSGQKLVDQS